MRVAANGETGQTTGECLPSAGCYDSRNAVTTGTRTV